MKKIIVLLMMALFLGGCTSISHYEHKFDSYASGFSPANVEKIVVERYGFTTHYLCVNYGTQSINCWGWYCWEYDEKDGHILKKREYWVDSEHWQDNDKNFERFKEKIKQ